MTDLDDPKVQRKVIAAAWALFFLIVALVIAAVRCAFIEKAPDEVPDTAEPPP